MARKRSPSSSTRKTSPPRAPPAEEPSPAPSSKSYMQRWRETQATGYDSAKWAMYELRLGRFAQVASLGSGFLLGLTAFIAMILNGSSPTNPPPLISNFRRWDTAIWFIPTITSFVVSGMTVWRKLGPYRRGMGAVHFLSSVVAFVVSILVLSLLLADHLSVMDLSSILPWMYPLSVLGLSLAFVSLALTWEGLGWRKGLSIAFSLAVPASMVAVPFLPSSALPPPILPAASYASLMLVYTYDALFIVFSGSLLHLIASAAEASQREIIRATDTRFSGIKKEMEQKLEALAYKEKAYLDRESHLEAKEQDLLELEGELDARTKDLNGVQAKLDQQGKDLTDLESKLAKMRAEVEVKVEEFGLKEKDLKAAQGQVAEARQSLMDREAALAGREKEWKRGEIEIASRQRAVEAKGQELADLESRLKKEGEMVDVRRDEVIKLEKELALKESEVRLKIEQLEAAQSTEMKDKMRELKDWESKILAKEREVSGRETATQSLAEELKQRQADGDAYAAALQAERERLAAREQELNAKEKEISDLGSAAGEKGTEIERRWQEVIEAQQRVEAREAEYNNLFKDAKLREADLTTTKEEVARRMAALDAREAKIKEWQGNLGGETKKLQDKYRELLGKEKALQAKESELSLKELEMTTKEREAARTPVPASGTVDVDREKYFEMWEQRMKGREEEFKRRMYQKEKELEAREMAVKEQLRAAAAVPGAEAEEAPAAVAADRGDKYKTGTPRLDDLLYGGLSMNANVLFVGPAFVGKEVAILNFIAEGLKVNIPAILVTTSKPPVEIAKEMAPVLPTFMEYDHLGLVRWIDASGTTPTQKLTRDGSTFRVPNATDFDGIISAVNAAEEDFRDKGAAYFRVAFLSLSSSISQADEKAAISFVQRFANRLRQSKCIAAFALERGMHTDQQIESLQQLMDGALLFKQEKSKTLMSVIGIGEVQTRDWVPYKFTNKALMIGSFQLERIR